MNWTELLIAIVSHVSWPGTVLLLAWMFRDSARSALARIDSAKSKYLNLTLRPPDLENLARGEGMAEALDLPPAPDPKRKPKAELTEFEDSLKQIMAFITRQPRSAFFDAWDLFMERAGIAIEKRTSKQPPSNRIIPETARFLDQQAVDLILLLQRIVEQQKSSPSEAIDKAFVLRFINLISRVILLIDVAAGNSSPDEIVPLVENEDAK